MQKSEKPEPNPVYLQLPDPEGRSEPIIIEPANIESPWTVEVDRQLPAHRDALIIVNSHIAGESTQTSQVSAYIKDVRALKEEEILVGSLSGKSRIVDEAEFLRCL